MKIINILGLAVLLIPSGHAAVSQTIGPKTCADLREEQIRYNNSLSGEWTVAHRDGDPVSQIIADYTQGLEGDALIRVWRVFREDIRGFCLNELDAQREDTLVTEAIEKILAFHNLDRTAPDWALKEIPVLDFHTQTMLEIVELASTNNPPNQLNDSFYVAITKYLRKYDIQTQSDLDAADKLVTWLSFEGGPEVIQVPLVEILDRLATEVGLQLRE